MKNCDYKTIQIKWKIDCQNASIAMKKGENRCHQWLEDGNEHNQVYYLIC
jgi:hypothetical protein